jgi:hypothetical protein
MRRTSIVVTAIVGFILLVTSTTSFAQARASAKSQVISGDFVGLFLSGKEIHAQYEWKAGPVNSWFIRALFGQDPLKYNGLGIGGGYRFFIADSRALTGLGIAPVVVAYFWSHEFLPAETFVSVGGEVSYKWIFDDFSVEPLLGAGIAFGGNNISYLTTMRGYLGIYLGYAW